MNDIITGDARELAKGIPDGSIDLIFTDPPYPKEFLPLYYWLAEEAARVLKPGGFLLAYTPSYWKDRIFTSFNQHLTYFWDIVAIDRGSTGVAFGRRMVTMCKSILVFTNGIPAQRTCNVFDVWSGGKEDKRFHAWGQRESTASYYINHFSAIGDTVWEPFCGGGTTPTVCKQLDRNFISFEVNPDTATIARQRLATVQPLLFAETPTQSAWNDEVVA